MVIWSILRPFGIFVGHLVCFMVIWYVFYRFGTLYKQKSGNPDRKDDEGEHPMCRKQFLNLYHRNLKTRSRTKPWKVKKNGVKVPEV
jgi:hypothetical protein